MSRESDIFGKIVAGYLDTFPEEKALLELPLRQIADKESLTSRKNFNGHFTASAFVVNPDTKSVLLLHHKFMDKFFQPGGHIDDGEHPTEAAYRELQEETGITSDLVIYKPLTVGDDNIPLDIDSHFIPDNPGKDEKSHYHHDIRYLVTYKGSDVTIDDNESISFKWVSWNEFSGDLSFKKSRSQNRKNPKLTSLSIDYIDRV